MLPAPYRLRGKQRLQRAQRSSHVVRTQQFSLRVVSRGDAGVPRISIAVGKRVSPHAVERNRITRWVREALRIVLSRIHPGVDLRISATGASSTYSYNQCVADIEQVLHKAKLLRRA